MSKIVYNPFTGNFDMSGDGVGDVLGTSLTTRQTELLGYLSYDSDSRILSTTRAFETTLNSLYLGGQHKMSSGAENIFFTNLGNDTNFYPMWGGLKDQSIVANQGASGFIPPSGRVYTDMFSLQLGGNPAAGTSIGYSGSNPFSVNIAGLGITTTVAEAIDHTTTRLEYRLSIAGRQVYMQELDLTASLAAGDLLEWFFDHPVEIHAGTTIFAEIRKVSLLQQTTNAQTRITTDLDLGVLQVRVGDDGTGRYQAIVHNRLFEDKDLELISPYFKYQAMDFSVDATGGSILLKNLSLATGSELLIPHPINTLQAVATGTTIQIKHKGGAKIIIESLPVNATSINGTMVNAVLNSAVAELNNLFTNALSFAVQDNPVTAFALSGDDLTITLQDGTSYTADVTTLGVDTDNFVSSAALSGNIITLTMDDATSVFIDAAGLAIDNDTTIVSGSVAGNTMSLTTNTGSIITVDVTSLATGSSTQVSSGAVVGTNLVLTMSDASTVTIDATNMINGSTMSATNDQWYISYGTNANQPVGSTTMDATVVGSVALRDQGPYYFGQTLIRGSEFKFNINTGNQLRLGIWDGPEVATAYNASPAMTDASNWNTVFSFANGNSKFTSSSNTDVTTYHASGYVATNGAPMSIRFGDDGHLTLLDLSGGTEVIVGKTTIALSVTSFNIQFGGFSNSAFPSGIISTIDWTVVHDFAGTEAGIVNGILDHTVLKSNISIEMGEKIMFMLDEVGTGDFFGTDYTAATTGVSTAEEQLNNTFIYQTNEAIVFDTASGVSDWNANTNATHYFNAASLNQYRDGGAGTIQGMFSLRFNTDGKLTIYDEDVGQKIATAKANPTVGSSVSLYFGVKGNRAYYSIPVISKQSLDAGSQPDTNFAPDISNQSVSVQEGDTINATIALDSGSDIVSMYGETDAPSWLILNQSTGVFSGTAPVFTGSSDAYVVNCKAANSIGGVTNFTVTFNVTSYASTNTKSLKFTNGQAAYLAGAAGNVPSLARSGTGAGASDAWSVSMWIKPSTSTSQQSLFYYGGDAYTKGSIRLSQFSGNNLIMYYGNNTDYLVFFGVSNFPSNQWNHVLITYSGNATGNTPADLSTYLTQFTMSINGANGISQVQHGNSGYDGTILDEKFKVGRALEASNPDNLNDAIVNQIAIWGSDESANLADIYNSGATQDLEQLTSPPLHYYEIESSITTIADIIGGAPMLAYNFTASDLVTDTP